MANVSVGANSENRLLAALPTDVLVSLKPSFKNVTYAQGRVLFEPGDAVDQIYFPQTGMISLLMAMKDGSTVETATVGREGAVGLTRGLGERRWLTRAVIQVSGVFSVIQGGHFQQAIENSFFAHDAIARYMEVLWLESQQLSACNARHDALARLCRWMLQCSDRIGSNNLPLTQEFLSQMLGVRRTTVTLLAQTLQTNGLIRYSRGKIMILDRTGVEACACECYQAIHQDRLPIQFGFD